MEDDLKIKPLINLITNKKEEKMIDFTINESQ